MGRNHRRNIILQEIAYWRQSKVLPEQYCDFLMNLYQDEHSESAAATAASSWRSVSRSSISNSHWKPWVIVCIVLLSVSLLVINFSILPFIVQVAISASIVIASYIVGFRKIEGSKAASYAYVGIGSIVLLWSGHYLLKTNGYEDSFWLIGYIVACSIIWIVMGLILNFGLLQFCGWLGIVMLYSWLLHTHLVGMHWLPVQLFWLPLTLFFIWIGWLLQRRQKSSGFIYCLVGLLLWFVPDGYLIFVSDEVSIWMQLLLVFKIGMTVFVLYAFRKKWTEWVV